MSKKTGICPPDRAPCWHVARAAITRFTPPQPASRAGRGSRHSSHTVHPVARGRPAAAGSRPGRRPSQAALHGSTTPVPSGPNPPENAPQRQRPSGLSESLHLPAGKGPDARRAHLVCAFLPCPARSPVPSACNIKIKGERRKELQRFWRETF